MNAGASRDAAARELDHLLVEMYAPQCLTRRPHAFGLTETEYRREWARLLAAGWSEGEVRKALGTPAVHS